MAGSDGAGGGVGKAGEGDPAPRGCEASGEVSRGENDPGKRVPTEPHLKWLKKTDAERFECQRFERRDKFKDFFRSLNRFGKKPKP